MSEPSEVFGISEEDSELDFDAIFGGSAETPSDPLPFPEPPQSALADETPEAADAVPVTEEIPASTAPTQSASERKQRKMSCCFLSNEHRAARTFPRRPVFFYAMLDNSSISL